MHFPTYKGNYNRNKSTVAPPPVLDFLGKSRLESLGFVYGRGRRNVGLVMSYGGDGGSSNAVGAETSLAQLFHFLVRRFHVDRQNALPRSVEVVVVRAIVVVVVAIVVVVVPATRQVSGCSLKRE